MQSAEPPKTRVACPHCGQRIAVPAARPVVNKTVLGGVVAAAFLALMAAAVRAYPVVGLCGAIALCAVGFSAVRFALVMREAQLPIGLVGFQWGWGILVLGGLLLLITGFLPRE